MARIVANKKAPNIIIFGICIIFFSLFMIVRSLIMLEIQLKMLTPSIEEKMKGMMIEYVNKAAIIEKEQIEEIERGLDIHCKRFRIMFLEELLYSIFYIIAAIAFCARKEWGRQWLCILLLISLWRQAQILLSIDKIEDISYGIAAIIWLMFSLIGIFYINLPKVSKQFT